jgi:hypothetical protein
MDSTPSVSTGAIGSRFISQEDVDAVRAVREEQWKAAYARSVQIISPWNHTKSSSFLDLARNLHLGPQMMYTTVGAWQK